MPQTGISLFNLLTDEFNDLTSVNTVDAMNSISHQIENVVMNNFLPVDFYAGFQKYSHMHAQRKRYERLANAARRVFVFGIPDDELPPVSGIEYVPLEEDSHLAEEWFLVINTPYFYTTLITKEIPGRDPITGQRRFKGAWTFNEEIVSQAYLLLSQFLGMPYRPIRQRDYESQSRYAATIANNMIVKMEKTNLERKNSIRLSEAMVNIANSATREQSLEKTLDDVVGHLQQEFNVRTVTLWNPEPKSGEIVLKSAAGLPSNWRDAAYQRQSINSTPLLAAEAFHKEKTVTIDNAERENRPDMFDPAAKSIIATPMVARGQMMGILQLTSPQEDLFDEDETSSIEAIAMQLGLTILSVQSAGRQPQPTPAAPAAPVADSRMLQQMKSQLTQMNDEVLNFLSTGQPNQEQMQVVNRIVKINEELVDMADQMGADGNGSTADASATAVQNNAADEMMFDYDDSFGFGEMDDGGDDNDGDGLRMTRAEKEAFIDKVEAGQPDTESVRLQTIVSNIIETYRPLARERGVELENRIPDDMTTIEADREQIKIAIQEMVDNAVRYSGRDTKVHVLSNTDVDSAVIAVRDTGRGIAMDDMPFIFNEGYRSADVDEDGDGLGLTMVKAVAEKHGGRTWARSKPNQGSIVFLKVPLSS